MRAACDRGWAPYTKETRRRYARIAVAKIFDRIDEQQRDWIARQRLFFVGTAPLSGDGHVNVSPKGPIGSLCVIDDHTVAYLDSVGSGAETIAHLNENGRVVVMLCAFEGPPRILRLHGRGEAVLSSIRASRSCSTAAISASRPRPRRAVRSWSWRSAGSPTRVATACR